VCIIFVFVREIALLQEKSGTVFLVKYLKACSTLLIGNTATSSKKRTGGQAFGAAVSMTSTGLPRLIPAVHRRLIRNGSLFHVRM